MARCLMGGRYQSPNMLSGTGITENPQSRTFVMRVEGPCTGIQNPHRTGHSSPFRGNTELR
jgi:hypothetical protein